MGHAFDEAFPHYLAMGMTNEQYWEQDCALVIPYRKAYRIKQEEANRLAWLQGMYFFEALCDVSPIMHAFAKSGTTVRPYPEKPYEFKTERDVKRAERNQQKIDNAVAFMHNLAARFNKSRQERLLREQDQAAAANDAVATGQGVN